jgi:hypothetical protein
MKSKLLLSILLLAFTISINAQQTQAWGNWTWLMGEWKGEGNGEPGKGSGTFSFTPDLDKKVLVRKAHSEYPATDTKRKVVHDDLMVVYLDYSGNPSKAIYFDNEGHTINYSISYSDKAIVLLSEKMPHVPVFRLTYSLLDNDIVNTKFEMSMDGEKFTTYVEGKSKKMK